jgi:hypothetical protein
MNRTNHIPKSELKVSAISRGKYRVLKQIIFASAKEVSTFNHASWKSLRKTLCDKRYKQVIFVEELRFSKQIFNVTIFLQEGSPVHVAHACVGSGKGSDHFRSYIHSFSCISARGCFQDLTNGK